MINLQPATISSIPAIVPLLEQLGYPVTPEELEKRFTNFIKKDGYGVVIATYESQPIGMISWSKSHLFVQGKVRFHIECLIVDRNYRNQGVGKKLMLFVEEVAKISRPAIIDLTSGVRRAKDGSHDFYKALGYNNEGHRAKLYLRKEV